LRVQASVAAHPSPVRLPLACKGADLIRTGCAHLPQSGTVIAARGQVYAPCRVAIWARAL
jgi:hypothetical protein